MKTAGRKNTYIAARTFQILFFDVKREEKTIWNHGGAIFRCRAHGPCAHDTMWKSAGSNNNLKQHSRNDN